MAYATGKAGLKVDIPKATQMLTAAAQCGDEQRMLDMMAKDEGMFHKPKNKH